MTIKKLHGVTVLVLFVLAIIASVVGLVAHDEWMQRLGVILLVIVGLRWLPIYSLPIYAQTWTSGEMRFRSIAWGVLVVVGAAIFWTERKQFPMSSIIAKD